MRLDRMHVMDRLKGFRSDYVLSSGRDGHSRLKLLSEVHDPHTRRLLLRAGLGPESSLVEFGCGLGSVSRWAVSLGARATGIDLSPDHISEARRLARADGLNAIDLRVGNVFETGLAPRTFDVAHCRYLLSHVSRPLEAMRQMVASLKPGGALTCEEPDITTIFCEPPSADYDAIVKTALQVAAMRDMDFQLGPKLAALASELGLEAVREDTYQLQFRNGRAKGYWTWSFAEARPALLATGVPRDDLDKWLSGMRSIDMDGRFVVGHARMYQLVARKRTG